jgi:hypothetical protein
MNTRLTRMIPSSELRGVVVEYSYAAVGDCPVIVLLDPCTRPCGTSIHPAGAMKCGMERL